MTSQRTSADKNKSAKTKKVKAKGTPKSKVGRWLWFAIGMGGIAMVSGMAGALLAVSWDSKPLQQAALTATEAAVFEKDRISGEGFQFSQLTRPVNILVMGMSVLPPDLQDPPEETNELGYLPQINSFSGLADVMLLIKFDPETKKVIMLSIPRDTRTRVEGIGIKKINSTNVDGGPALTAKTVSNLLGGVAIDRYVRINVLGVSKLINALGGVSVYVPKDMKYVDESQHLYIDLKAGQQHLDGDQTLQLLRFRHDELGDIGRIQRQQMVMRALIEQTLNPNTLTRLPDILNTVRENIDTNLSVEELVALVGFGAKTNRANMQMLMLPGRFSEQNEYEYSYWIPYKREIRKLMVQNFDLESEFDPEVTDPARLRVAIQDSTGSDRSEIRPLVLALRKAGYRNVVIYKPWSEPLEVSNIITQKGDTVSAESIRNTLGFGQVKVESTGSIGSDISIQVGKDWLQNKWLFEADSR